MHLDFYPLAKGSLGIVVKIVFVIEISAVLKLFHVGSVITLGTHEQDLPHLLTQGHFFEDLLCALFDLGLLAC